MRLAGEPTAAFADRFLLTVAPICVVDMVALATLLVAWPLFARRVAIPPSGHVWMALQYALYTAQIAMHRCGARPAWRERCAVALRLNSFGMCTHAGSTICKLWLDQTPPVTGPLALARHFLLMLFSSGAVTSVLLQAEVMRFSLALPVQLLVFLNTVAFNVPICSSAALSHPQAQQHTRHLFRHLEMLNFSLLPMAARVEPAAECAAVLGYLQLAGGLVLPLLAHAALESRLFREHQRQRRRCGLPAESSRMLWLYSTVNGLSEEVDGAGLAAAVWMLLGVLWKIAVAVAFHQTEGDCTHPKAAHLA